MIYPFEDLAIKNHKGETWKDVDGYEGYYQVSSIGRVRSVDRIIPHPRLHRQFVQGRILKQKVVKDFNKLTGDAMISLQVAFTMEGSTHYYNVRRLVYAAFKTRINFQKDGLYVLNKDGNGYNNRVANLVLTPKAEKVRRSIKKGRVDFEYLTTIDRSGWKKNYPARIPVNQYTLNGKLVKKYKSITAAHNATGFDAKGISQAAKGFYKGTWRGFVWKYA